MDFRKRPDQAGKPIIEISKAASVAWRLLTEEEKDVSPPFPLHSYLPMTDIAEISSRNTEINPPSRLPPRKVPELSGPSRSSYIIRFYSNSMSAH